MVSGRRLEHGHRGDRRSRSDDGARSAASVRAAAEAAHPTAVVASADNFLTQRDNAAGLPNKFFVDLPRPCQFVVQVRPRHPTASHHLRRCGGTCPSIPPPTPARSRGQAHMEPCTTHPAALLRIFVPRCLPRYSPSNPGLTPVRSPGPGLPLRAKVRHGEMASDGCAAGEDVPECLRARGSRAS